MASAALRSPSTGHLPSLPRLLPFLPVSPSPILTQPFLLFLSSASPFHSLPSYSSILHVSLYPNNISHTSTFIYFSFLTCTSLPALHSFSYLSIFLSLLSFIHIFFPYHTSLTFVLRYFCFPFLYIFTIFRVPLSPHFLASLSPSFFFRLLFLNLSSILLHRFQIFL